MEETTQAPAKATAEKKVTVYLARDCWLEADVRTPAGSPVDLPAEEAMDGIESGLYTRKKPE